MNLISQYKQKVISCRRLETKSRSVRNDDFGFRRKAQVRTNYHFNFMQLIFSTSKTQDRNNINTRYNIIYLIL